MCCFFATLLFFGPRLGMLIFWLFPYGQVKINLAFKDFNYPWLVGILGLVFIPWATLMYVIVYPLNGFDYVWVGLAVGADIFAWIGGDRNRHKVPGYTSAAGSMDPPPAPPATPPAQPAA